jgi:hypothetical protein
MFSVHCREVLKEASGEKYKYVYRSQDEGDFHLHPLAPASQTLIKIGQILQCILSKNFI